MFLYSFRQLHRHLLSLLRVNRCRSSALTDNSIVALWISYSVTTLWRERGFVIAAAVVRKSYTAHQMVSVFPCIFGNLQMTANDVRKAEKA